MPRTVRTIVFKRPIAQAKQEIDRVLRKYYFFAYEYNGETVWMRNNYGSGVPAVQYLRIEHIPVGVHLEAWIVADGGTEELTLTGFSGGSAGIILRIIIEEIQASV